MICECGHRQEIHEPLCRGAVIQSVGIDIKGASCPCDEFVADMTASVNRARAMATDAVELVMADLAAWLDVQWSHDASIRRSADGRWTVELRGRKGTILGVGVDVKFAEAVTGALGQMRAHSDDPAYPKSKGST